MESKRQQIAVVLSRFPFPLEKGDKLRAYFQLLELSKHFDVHLFCVNPKKPRPDQLAALKDHCKSVEVAVIPVWQSLLSCLFGALTDRPFQSHYFYTVFAHRRFKKFIEANQIEFIYCQLIRMAAYVKNMHHVPKSIDYMDAFSAGMRRRIHTEPQYKRWLYRMESNRLRNYESLLFDYFDHQYIITEQDRDEIMHPHKQDIHILTNGISPMFLESPSPTQPTYDLTFIGNLSYPPNVLAVKRIIFDILPKSPKQYRVLIAGANPTTEIQQWVESNTSVHLMANPHNILEAYLSGQVLLAPMSIGTGLQNKLLEAMSLGIPCITTPLANNALGATANKEIFIGENDEELVVQIDRALGTEGKQVGQAGKTYVQQHFSWEGSMIPVVKKIEESLSGR